MSDQRRQPKKGGNQEPYLVQFLPEPQIPPLLIFVISSSQMLVISHVFAPFPCMTVLEDAVKRATLPILRATWVKIVVIQNQSIDLSLEDKTLSQEWVFARTLHPQAKHLKRVSAIFSSTHSNPIFS